MVLALARLLCDEALAQSAQDRSVEFRTDILPILQQNCWGCHDRETRDGGVSLDNFHQAHLPSDSGRMLFVPKRPQESMLLQVLTTDDPRHRMPLDDDPLTADQIRTIRQWIQDGAVWPDDGWRPEVHWSFRRPQRPAVPDLADGLADNRHPNQVDAFVLAKLKQVGLTVNPETEPERLIRRIYLDLTGLPPSIQEVEEFVADPSFANYQVVVDRLLASPAFGEKWAIHWLDLARYADSEGYQRDSPRAMWPWRDWVINAFNEDMPIDQFTIEQLAGDLLPDASESQIVATGFHRNAATNLEAGTDPQEDRYKTIVDRVNTTGTVWLGLTVGCAQCHNHKYDPITAKEYYQLFAFFNNTPMETRQLGDKMGMSGLEHIGPEIQVTLTDDDQQALQQATRQFDQFLSRQEAAIRDLIDSQQSSPKSKPLAQDIQKLLDHEEPWTLAQCRKAAKSLPGGKASAINARLADAQQMSDRLDAQRKNSVRVMAELPEPKSTFVAMRGDFMSTGQEVAPATPAALHPFPNAESRNRLGLARWLVSEDNPLVSRTFVNRVWQELFGQGLVKTAGDFGVQGELPTHPDLLDWLAVAFIEKDHWSMKKVIRRIVLSATYRQSVAVHKKGQEIDPRNRLLWRHPGQRLKAEVIRDQALAVSGLLNQRLGGVHVRPFQPPTFWRKTAGAGETKYLPSQGENAYRRGIYTMWRRNAHYPSFANFDAPDRAACVVQRDTSNTPLQALTLLNDPAYVEMMEAFGDRIHEQSADVDQKIVWAFRTVLARHPSSQEIQTLRDAYQRAEQRSDESMAARELAVILLNLHETIHRS